MKRNPLYVFKDVNSTGIFEIPLNSVIQIIQNINNISRVLLIEIIGKTGTSQATTISEFLLMTTLYNVLSDGTTGGELQKFVEEIQPGVINTGYKLADSDPARYGPVGSNSIDFSFQDGSTTFDKGALGEYSFALGSLTQASGLLSFVGGKDSISNGKYSFSFGLDNQSLADNSITFGTSNKGLGLNAFAVGNLNTASGVSSQALGVNTSSSNIATLSKGYKTQATGFYSEAGGNLTQAAGIASISGGKATIASGDYSQAFGDTTVASGESSTAQGKETLAEGYYSHAEGFLSQAIGEASHAEGDSNLATGNYSHAEGKLNTASGSNSHAEGFDNQALGISSHTEGSSNIASGDSSSAGGLSTEASGDNAFTRGYQTKASGVNSTSFGVLNTSSGETTFSIGISNRAIGNNTFVSGFNTEANGKGSIASGYKTISNSEYSSVFGFGTISNSPNMIAMGRYNIGKLNLVLEVGAGTISTPKNIFEITDQGLIQAPGLLGQSITNLPLDNLITKEILESEISGVGVGLESQLELIQEGPIGAEKTGWRLFGADPSAHANIGQNAIDITYGTFGTNFDVGAPGDYSFAANFNTLAEGNNSSSFGWNNKATGENTFSKGKDTLAQGINSSSEGYTTKAIGEASHAEGILSEANGRYSHAEGISVKADGEGSHAEGKLTQASGFVSISSGYNTISSGDQSSVFGLNNNVQGNNSSAFGENNIVQNENSFALGTSISLNAPYTLAFGKQLLANYDGLVALGNLNKGNDNTTIFEIGNGYLDYTDPLNPLPVRENALEIYDSGLIVSPQSSIIEIDTGSDKSLITKEYMVKESGRLAQVKEGVLNNEKKGFRLRRDIDDTLFKGDIGEGAVDLTYSNNNLEGWGATGDYSLAGGHLTESFGNYSFAFGNNNHALKPGSVAFGLNTRAEEDDGSFALGRFNIGGGGPANIDTILQVGIGYLDETNPNNPIEVRKNGFVVYATDDLTDPLNPNLNAGRVTAPELTTDMIDNDQNGLAARTLLTREYFILHQGAMKEIDEGNGIGWGPQPRRDNIVPNWGSIGLNALDISASNLTGGLNGALAENSVAFGMNTTASGIRSFAQGFQTTASGINSHSEGYKTTSSANYGSHAEGSNTTASGNASHAEGGYTTASANASHAEGVYTIASGNASHAEGGYTTSSANGTHAEGYKTTASANASHAEGSYTVAGAIASHAEGVYTIAQNVNQHSAGSYNIGTSIDTIHETGIGLDDLNRKNAFEIYTDGRIHAPEQTIVLHDNPQSLTTKAFTEFTYINASGDAMTGNLDMSTNLINNLGNPIAATDAVNMQYADATYINASGDAMTGNLTVNNNGTVIIGDGTTDFILASNLIIPSGELLVNGIVGLSIYETVAPSTTFAPTASESLTRKDYVDTEILNAVANPINITDNEFTATAGQTNFIVLGVLLTSNIIEVYNNGSRIRKSGYIITNNGIDTTITLSVAATVGDEITIVNYRT